MNDILNTYIEITEGSKPVNVVLLKTQNARDGSIFKLYDVEMPDYDVRYIESLENGCNYVFKATIRDILQIFGSEIADTLYSKEQIEDYLRNEGNSQK